MDEREAREVNPEEVEDLLRRRCRVLLEVLELGLAGLPREVYLRRAMTLLLEGEVSSLLPRGAAFLFDSASQTLALAAQVGLDPERIESCAMVPVDCCACGRAAGRGQVVVERHDQPRRGRHGHCGVAEPHLHCSVPLVWGEKLEGVLALMYGVDSTPGADERVFLERIARGVAGVLHKAHQVETLAEKAARATSELRAHSEYLATITHELRTPLNGILGMSELLQKTALDGEQIEYVETLRGSAQGMLRLAEEILDREQLEAGEMTLERIPFDLCELAESVIALLLPSAPSDVALRLRVASNAPRRVEGDPARLKQVLLNLLGNAIKFTTAGQVLLSVHREPAPGGDLLYFAVQDTGPGIPVQRQQAIFDRWQQEEQSTVRRFGGSGLGLSISRRLVELMGGRIGVHSSPGEGSVFWFTIPLLETIDEPAIVKADELFSGRRVMLVESDESPGLILEEQLRAWGIDVVRAKNTGQALENLRNGPRPWAILVGNDGDHGSTSFPAAVSRAVPDETPHLLKIVSLDERRGGARCPAAGYRAHLREPVRGQLLRHALEELLDGGAESAAGILEQSEQEPLCLRVLVVDDNPVNLRVASGMLERVGCEPDCAAGGAEALQRLAAERYDVLLVDWQMPEIDGPAVARRVAAEPSRYGNPLIIGLTAAAGSESRDVFAAAGVELLLHKPLDLVSLRRVLAAASPLPLSR